MREYKIGSCVWCKSAMLYNLDNKMTCSTKCYIRCRKYGLSGNDSEIKRANWIKAGDLLIEFKRKRWYIDHIDVFRLIDIHSNIWPNRTSKGDNPEDMILSMLGDIISGVKRFKELNAELDRK